MTLDHKTNEGKGSFPSGKGGSVRYGKIHLKMMVAV